MSWPQPLNQVCAFTHVAILLFCCVVHSAVLCICCQAFRLGASFCARIPRAQSESDEMSSSSLADLPDRSPIGSPIVPDSHFYILGNVFKLYVGCLLVLMKCGARYFACSFRLQIRSNSMMKALKHIYLHGSYMLLNRMTLYIFLVSWTLADNLFTICYFLIFN